jgi:hypothetical protein
VDLTGNLGTVINPAIAGITYVASGSACSLAGIESGNTARYEGEVETSAVFVN